MLQGELRPGWHSEVIDSSVAKVAAVVGNLRMKIVKDSLRVSQRATGQRLADSDDQTGS